MFYKYKKMIQRITSFLTEKPSYLKHGNERLANKFGCSTRTIVKIKKNLAGVKKEYLASL